MEANAGWGGGGWILQGSAQWLRARREGSQDPALNGKRPTNVPRAALKMQARYDVGAMPGLSVQADMLAESDRMVLPDNSARVPGYGRLDASLRYMQSTSAGPLIWRAGVDNVFNRRAWKESPFEFGHAYLFPLPARTLRFSVEAAL